MYNSVKPCNWVMNMYSNEFESAFSAFLERHEYDEAENYLFSMLRLAFAAGWQSAGGAPPQSERIFELLPKNQEHKTSGEL